jgi:recombination protein RecT
MPTTVVPTTDSTPAVQKRAHDLPVAMVSVMQGLMPAIPRLLPPDISTEQFRAALFLELSGRPALSDCTPDSLRDCVVKAATYGLLPGRDCHFLPFRSKRGGNRRDATYVPNYHGIILALERSGKVRRAFAHAVHEGDEWGFDMFADRPLHRPAVTIGKKPGKELFYYGAIMFRDGTCAFEVLSLEDLDALEKRSPAHDEGPWRTDRPMMRRKSALKRVAKYVKLTPELQTMLADDDAREREDIPEDRHRQTLVDLFGDVPPTSTVTQHTPKKASSGAKEASTTSSQGPDTPNATTTTEETKNAGSVPEGQGASFDYTESAQMDRETGELLP